MICRSYTASFSGTGADVRARLGSGVSRVFMRGREDGLQPPCQQVCSHPQINNQTLGAFLLTESFLSQRRPDTNLVYQHRGSRGHVLPGQREWQPCA